MAANAVQVSVPPRSAEAILKEIRRGNFMQELGFFLAGLTQDVIATQKQGTISIKLVVKPSKVADNAIEIHDTLSATPPKKEVKPTLYFADAEGALTRDDPNEIPLPMKVVEVKGGQTTEKPVIESRYDESAPVNG